VWKILLADDEENLRMLVRTTLEDPEYEILEAGDGPATLEVARKQLPDVVVLDWMMPGMSGIEVARALRADPATREIPILMLTAKGQEADYRQAEALGVEAYLVKPFSPLDILDRIQRILR
jgi:CheY-like chemotaxis protein